MELNKKNNRENQSSNDRFDGDGGFFPEDVVKLITPHENEAETHPLSSNSTTVLSYFINLFQPRIRMVNNEKKYSYFNDWVEFRSELVWLSVLYLSLLHLAGIYGTYLALLQIFNFQFTSVIFMYAYGWYAGLFGICIGAHRLWSHRAFKAKTALKVILIIANTISGQNSCYYWIRDHRLHHKFSDTNADPHNATRGFFFSHIGWLMMKKHPEIAIKGKSIDMSDIESDFVVMFQKRYFKQMFLIFSIIIPVFVPCFFWNETLWNSLFICFFLRYMLLLNITWSINSIAHMFGTRPYDKHMKPAENLLVSLLSQGEGWHNYHHAFPWDYKASDFGVNLNVSRRLIEGFAWLGLAYDLRQPSEEMKRQRASRTGDGSYSESKQNL